MIVECPHCLTRVVATTEGHCPACRADMQEEAADPTRTARVLQHAAQVPNFCITCAEPTVRRVRVSRSISRESDQADSTAGLFFVLAFCVSLLFLPLALLGLRGRTRDVIAANIPQCRECSKQGKPEPIRVNAEELTMTFATHKEFDRIVDEACGQPA